ncbi:hypothetical protein [Streptomyces calvus]|uniref:hypothetical protein n=1 Tax=Streptomyces calvus TaxID=67282 RepID=UPI003717AC67
MNVDKVINGNQCTDAARAAENAGIRSDGFAIATGDTEVAGHFQSRSWRMAPGAERDRLSETGERRARPGRPDAGGSSGAGLRATRAGIERNEIAEPVLAACLEYVEAAHEAIDCGEVPPRLPEAKERFVARRARWEEARRQVLHILATAPGPRGEAG